MTEFLNHSVDLEAQPENSAGTGAVYEMSHRTSGSNGEAPSSSGDISSDEESEQEKISGSAAHPRVQDQEQGGPPNSGFGINEQPSARDDGIQVSDNTPQLNPSQTPRMVGDFDDSADALWSLHGKEARRNDEIRIQSLKDDMGGVLIFVYSQQFSPPLSSIKSMTSK
ncbi:hypothetical protein EI94DRAFT_242677 [Lactarius quietus]|nr:hypothetical protein EI94DRAFT_242677 [Lactarius quietus]